MSGLNSPLTIDDQSNSSEPTLVLDGKQVLLAEDCVDQGRLYLRFLERAGTDVTLECSGQSAVDAVEKSPTRFDAVVMDFQMPELDGLEATERLRALGYTGPIIAVTAFSSEELRLAWFKAGCDEFLEKPLTKATLIKTVMQHTATVSETV
ncbi:MAG: response regulator [Planctomycetaceae bacterium]|jgi:two-component system, sensor histidine kinase|nr:response regulator [Planctomycetaceae bacterium]MBT6483540.1 response regulator [Planctomycetaceae bacterium]MBT6494876.1 response regulator [Planctomycetaceae bacterium]